MDNIVKEVFEIIKDYRSDENVMSKDRIYDWINQFHEEDRIFFLEETKNILSKRYISEDKAKELVKGIVAFLSEKFEYACPKAFLLDSIFLDVQPEGKSQKILLQFVNDVIVEEYGISISDCQSESPKYYLYMDDVLCTGDTLVKNLTRNTEDEKGWFNLINSDGKSNLEIFKENKAKLVLGYFSIHQPNIKKARNRIYYELGRQNIDFTYAWDMDYAIDKSEQEYSKFDFICPVEDLNNDLVIACKKQIESKIHNHGHKKDEYIKYRNSKLPTKESLFSSAENRNRYEKLILDKCVEIYNSSDRLKNEVRPRPLGYGLYTDMSFGFGTLIFTWRNVPYNVPLIFWYRNQNWIPLFERNHT